MRFAFILFPVILLPAVARGDVGLEVGLGMASSQWEGPTASTPIEFQGQAMGGGLTWSKGFGAFSVFAAFRGEKVSLVNESNIGGVVEGVNHTTFDSLLLPMEGGLGLRLGSVEIQCFGAWVMGLSPQLKVAFEPSSPEGSGFEGQGSEVKYAATRYGGRLCYPAASMFGLCAFGVMESGKLSYRLGEGTVTFTTSSLVGGAGIRIRISGGAGNASR